MYFFGLYRAGIGEQLRSRVVSPPGLRSCVVDPGLIGRFERNRKKHFRSVTSVTTIQRDPGEIALADLTASFIPAFYGFQKMAGVILHRSVLYRYLSVCDKMGIQRSSYVVLPFVSEQKEFIQNRKLARVSQLWWQDRGSLPRTWS